MNRKEIIKLAEAFAKSAEAMAKAARALKSQFDEPIHQDVDKKEWDQAQKNFKIWTRNST